MTAAPAYGPALDLVTRVRGVRGAMLVSGDDGIVVAEQLMEGIKGAAVAALASSLAARLRRAMEAAGVGASLFWHLQCDQGGLLVVPAPSGVLIVAVAEPDVNVGLVRLELLRAIDAAGVGPTLFWHLQCDKGGLLVVPTPSGVLIVAVAEPDVNVGLVRLELLRAAEAVG